MILFTNYLCVFQAHERECGGDANAITSPPSPPSPEPDLPDITQQVDPTDQVTSYSSWGVTKAYF